MKRFSIFLLSLFSIACGNTTIISDNPLVNEICDCFVTDGDDFEGLTDEGKRALIKSCYQEKLEKHIPEDSKNPIEYMFEASIEISRELGFKCPFFKEHSESIRKAMMPPKKVMDEFIKQRESN